MEPAKAKEMADRARDAGDPVGQQRYLAMLAVAKAAEPRVPTTRQRLEKAEQDSKDINKKLQLDLDKLNRWKKISRRIVSANRGAGSSA